MKHLLLATVLSLAFACGQGPTGPVCSANQVNRCSCGGVSEGLQVCLPSGQAFGACVCKDACANGADCVAAPSLVGMDMDQTGATLTSAGLTLPDPVVLDGGFTLVLPDAGEVNDPPVTVLSQNP